MEIEDIQFLWPLLGSFSLFLLARYFITKFYKKDILPKSSLGNHNWTKIVDTTKIFQCSICDILLINKSDEFVCDCCGICVDIKCLPQAKNKIQCKQISLISNVNQNEITTMKHHWSKGHILSCGTHSVCEVCEEDCEQAGELDLQCCWCQRTVHPSCKPRIAEVCDFGIYKKFIIPPHSITFETKRAGVRFRKSHVITIKSPDWNTWTPLIVLGNRKSGNGDGSYVLSTFRRILNPIQVVDLADKTPKEALQWVSLLPQDAKTLLLAAGGDGTAAWILNSVHEMKLDPAPGLGIIPLGTGNDLSRVLGWGSHYVRNAKYSPFNILSNLTKSNYAQLDRWLVQIKPMRKLRLTRTLKSVFMYNYLSIGVDAQVALDFHNTRESSFYLFSSRAFNKLLYVTFGTQQAMERGCRDLEQRIELYLDGDRMELPAIESVVVLNIPSWGAGVDLWKLGRDSEDGQEDTENNTSGSQKIDDEKLEVMALYSSFHIARLQVGLSEPLKLKQTSTVKIKLLDKTPMQVDGEPWLQSPAMITINYVDKATLLQVDAETDEDESSPS